ncbi:DUF1992 domain-containing protein [Kribbella sandramycini]|uniref:DUF1992 domain-containing protein n=1 Tax=Kribbella sandramycini TaxID=60450 RepID=A0A7Y4P2C5_9ACTN|nr:DUF1992 domain-containing protein [Kribbella sandramycini]MBB6566360.1 hypothetical protein [Kribbella sandramycini]NOL42979.1 DUF1992 domain-containing protein [Kribbella sandramycini]
MTSRKPPNVSFQEWVDHQVKEAEQAGEFDDLPGAGKPLKLADKHDPDWWVKDFIKRENLDSEALLPPAVLLRKEKQKVAETVAKMRRESEVREYLTDLNRRILLAIRDTTGPVVPVGKVDEAAVIAQWRMDHDGPPVERTEAGVAAERPRRRSIWQRLFS